MFPSFEINIVWLQMCVPLSQSKILIVFLQEFISVEVKVGKVRNSGVIIKFKIQCIPTCRKLHFLHSEDIIIIIKLL